MRHPHADAMFAEGRTGGNERLGTVVFPDGSVAVLPADGALQVAVARVAIAEATK